MADLKDVVAELAKISQNTSNMRMEFQQLKRDEGRTSDKSLPPTPERDARLRRMEQIDEQEWQNKKRSHRLEQQRSVLQSQADADKEAKDAADSAAKETAASAKEAAAADKEAASKAKAAATKRGTSLLSLLPGGFRSMASKLNTLQTAFPGLKDVIGGLGGAGGATGEAGAAGIAGAAGGAGGIGGAGIMGALGAATSLGPVGLAVAAVAAVGVAMVALPGMIKDWGQSLLDGQRHLAEFSGAMAMVFANSDWRDFQRSQRLSSDTAGSTGDLAASMSNLNDAWEPITALLIDIKNVLANELVLIVTPIMEMLGNIAAFLDGMLKELVGLNHKDEGDGIMMSEWMETTAGLGSGSVFSQSGQNGHSAHAAAGAAFGKALNPLGIRGFGDVFRPGGFLNPFG